MVLLLAVVTFVAHFLLLPLFGLYEDDYFYTLPVFGWDWPTWWAQVQDAILHPIQGRPLNHAVRRTLLHFTLNHGGLQAGYLVSWALVSINAFLVFRLVSKVTSRRAAIFAALIFIVYPADTSRQLLMHQSDLHFGMLLLLVALNVYGTGRIVASFVIAGLTLLTYESFYLPFVAAPFIFAPVRRPGGKTLIIHGIAFLGIAAAVLFFRSLLGEDRASEMLGSFDKVFWPMAAAGPIGMWTSAKMLIVRPWDALLHAEPIAWAIGLLVSLGAFACYRRTRDFDGGTQRLNAGHLALCGLGALAAWMVSYLLAFRSDYFPPIMTIGRLTAVHAPGALGAAIVTGVVVEMAQMLPARTRLLQGVAAAMLAAAVGFSASFGVAVQRSEYVAQWSEQIRFYNDLIELLPDLREGEVVVLDVEGDQKAFPITKGFPRFGMVNYGPLALRRFADWPKEWQLPPVIAPIWNGCPVQVTEDGLALFTPPWRFSAPQPGSLAALPSGIPVLHDGKFVMIAEKNGSIQRVSGPVEIGGHLLNARTLEETDKAALTQSRVFRMLSESQAQDEWFTLKHARNYPR